jgi:hypothetical protein
LEEAGMGGSVLILFEVIVCEGVEWIHLRNRGSRHPAADD